MERGSCDFDVCVVGAGTAGAVAALSASVAGARVALIDSKSRALIGRKVCGDTLSKGVVERIRHHLGIRLLEESLERELNGVEIFVEGVDFSIVGEVGFYSVNRHKFGQELLNGCIQKGVQLFDNCRFIEPLVRDSSVSGIRARSGNDDFIELNCYVTIDATGFAGNVRKHVASMRRPVALEDMWTCYREIRQLASEPEDFGYMKYYIDHTRAPGGITWMFPRSNCTVNTGVCLPPLAPTKPKDSYSRFIRDASYFENSVTLETAGALEPVRRPLDTLVSPGLMAVGDSACQTSPINGGGIDFSMYAAEIAGRVAANAASRRDGSEANLWPYNAEFMETIGREIVVHDVYRQLLANLNQADMASLLNKGLLNEHEFLHLMIGGKYSVSLAKKLALMVRLANDLPLYFRTVKTMQAARYIFSLYENFPPPEDFESWQSKVIAVFDRLKRLFQRP